MSSEKLVGVGRHGDFVHQHQNMGKEDGFRNVSQIWLDQTITIDAGIERLEAERTSRREISCKLNEVVIKHDGKNVVVMVDGDEFHPTRHALLQLGTKCDVPHTLLNTYSEPKLYPSSENVKYERDGRDLDLMVTALRLGQSRQEIKKPLLWRTYADNTLRAVLTDRYAIIDNRWYLEVLKAAIPDGRLSHWRGDADTLYGNVLIPDSLRMESDSEYGGMLSLSNCDIGKRRLAQYPSLFRAICMNGCIWDQTKGNIFRQIHRGKIDLDSLRKAIFENVNRQIPLISSHVDTFLKLRERKLSTTAKRMFAAISERYDFSPKQLNEVATAFVKHEKADLNAFGILNSITRAGQTLGNEDWVRFDVVGGSLYKMKPAEWEGLNAFANTLDEDTVTKMYAVAV